MAPSEKNRMGGRHNASVARRALRLTLYLTEEETRIIAEASEVESLSTGSFARSAVLKASKQILREEM